MPQSRWRWHRAPNTAWPGSSGSSKAASSRAITCCLLRAPTCCAGSGGCLKRPWPTVPRSRWCAIRPSGSISSDGLPSAAGLPAEVRFSPSAPKARLGNDLERHDLDRAAGHPPCLFGVRAEEGLALQCCRCFVVQRGGEVVVAEAVLLLHAAIGDPALQLGVAVQGRDEAGDFRVPGFGRTFLELVFDEKALHVGLR